MNTHSSSTCNRMDFEMPSVNRPYLRQVYIIDIDSCTMSFVVIRERCVTRSQCFFQPNTEQNDILGRMGIPFTISTSLCRRAGQPQAVRVHLDKCQSHFHTVRTVTSSNETHFRTCCVRWSVARSSGVFKAPCGVSRNLLLLRPSRRLFLKRKGWAICYHKALE